MYAKALSTPRLQHKAITTIILTALALVILLCTVATAQAQSIAATTNNSGATELRAPDNSSGATAPNDRALVNEALPARDVSDKPRSNFIVLKSAVVIFAITAALVGVVVFIKKRKR